ncbi:MAG: hypothetical protein GY847_38385 [Proteobacteria bacterium]|nr:hypothetical protein [Pseudomonadota bacterium]
MLVAVPIFGGDVAPRFGYADSFLIAEVADEKVVRVDSVRLEFKGWPNRLGQLRSLGVDTILCGGFNRCFMPLAEDLGIQVLAGLRGEANQILETFARGEAMPTFRCTGMGIGSGNGQGCNRNRSQGRGRGRNSQSR